MPVGTAIPGSILDLAAKIAALLDHFDKDIDETLARLKSLGVEASTVVTEDGKNLIELPYPLPGPIESQVHQEEEEDKDKLLLIAIHMRNLMETMSGKHNISLSVYDRKGVKRGSISLVELCSMLVHHRYAALVDWRIIDLFTGNRELAEHGFAAPIIDRHELVQAVSTSLKSFTCNDLIGLLRARLSKLSSSSERRELIFITQNVHSLAKLIRGLDIAERSPVLSLIFRDEIKQLSQVQKGHSEDMHVKNLEFKVANDIATRALMITANVNGESRQYLVDYTDLFDVMSQAFGDKSIAANHQT